MTIAETITQQEARAVALQGEIDTLTDQIATALLKGADVSILQREQALKSAELANLPALIEHLKQAQLAEEREKAIAAYRDKLRQMEAERAAVADLDAQIQPLAAQLQPLQEERKRHHYLMSSHSQDAELFFMQTLQAKFKVTREEVQ